MKKLAKQLEKLQQLIGDLRYETAIGIHTYHQCDCKRSATRRGRCKCCLLDDMQQVVNEMGK
jgi:hypothetical protein